MKKTIIIAIIVFIIIIALIVIKSIWNVKHSYVLYISNLPKDSLVLAEYGELLKDKNESDFSFAVKRVGKSQCIYLIAGKDVYYYDSYPPSKVESYIDFSDFKKIGSKQEIK